MFNPHSRWRVTAYAPGVIILLILLTTGISAYSFNNFPSGYTSILTPSKLNYGFNPASGTFTGLSSNHTVRNSYAVQATYSISGQVKVSSGAALSGVTLKLTSPEAGFTPRTITTTTSPYSFNNLPAGRTYILTPSKNYFFFTPASRTFTNLSANQTLRDFIGTRKTYTIDGQVKVGASALAGVTVTLTTTSIDLPPLTVVTRADGLFSFTKVPAGRAYKLQPSKEYYLFTPASRSYAELSANQTAQNFDATRKTYSIKGLALIGTARLAGVTMTLTSGSDFTPRTITTLSTGSYSFDNLPAGRAYVVTPSKTYYTFAPASRSYPKLIAHQTWQNFDATLKTYSIKGVALVGTARLPGVTMTLTSGSDFTPRTITTSSTGSYSFDNLPAGRAYVVTPSKTYYTFAPASRSFTNLSAHQISQSFDGTLKTYSISGSVSTGASDAVGVTMTLTSPTPGGFLPRKITTSGSYSFDNLPAGRTYILTPSNVFYTFVPASRTLTDLHAHQTSQSFKGTLKLYNISGVVSSVSSVLSGVTLKLTSPEAGFTPRTITTTTSPYSFNNLPAGRTYILTPSKTDYNFTPASLTLTRLSANQTSRDFLGAIKTYSIDGQVRVGAGALGSVAMKLTCQTPDGFTSARVFTNSTGVYSFTGVPVGCVYTVTPSKAGYVFTPFNKVISSLSANEVGVDFTAVADVSHSIRGTVKSGANALGGVVVKISGTRAGTTVTDQLGGYAFDSLPANGDYTITLLKDNYRFTPSARSYNDLGQTWTSQDYQAAQQTFTISGQTIISGATVTLSGSASATITTDSSGSFAFTRLTRGGNYTVTASKQSYVFSPPSQSFVGLDSNQRADFAIVDGPSHVLAFNGSVQKVDYGKFWPPDVDLGHFFWEFWAMPGEGAGDRYLISDGYGGAHALLFGFYGPLQANYSIGGNVYDGSNSTTFGSDEGPLPYEWGHYAVGWDGETIVTYYNGVPVGKKSWSGPRRASSPSIGGGKAFVGGSTHQNFIGKIAQLRAYEGRNPLEANPGINLELSAFTPQTIFSDDDPFWQNSSLLSSFARPTYTVVDLSGNNHVGLIKGEPPPQFVIDPAASSAKSSNAPATGSENVTTTTPPSIPDNARVFDSFSRGNATYAFEGNGGLGSTEGGTAGPQVWQYSKPSDHRAPFGILNGRAVILSNNMQAAWVPTGISSANIIVRVARNPGRWGNGISTGLVFRWRDPQNFFYAFTTGDAADTQKLTIGLFGEGMRRTLTSGVAMPERWTTLRVVTLRTGSINVYADTVLVYSTTSNLLINDTNAGIWNSGYGRALANRWDNFMVLEAQ